MRRLHAVAEPDGVGRGFEATTHTRGGTALAIPEGFGRHLPSHINSASQPIATPEENDFEICYRRSHRYASSASSTPALAFLFLSCEHPAVGLPNETFTPANKSGTGSRNGGPSREIWGDRRFRPDGFDPAERLCTQFISRGSGNENPQSPCSRNRRACARLRRHQGRSCRVGKDDGRGGVERSIILTDATGAEFDRLADLYLKAYPDRFQLYCGLDTTDIGASDYPQRAVRELVRCYEKGARGVGELSDKGWGYNGSSKQPLPRNQRLHPDDPRLDLFWKKCAELKIPVNTHIADHPSCWQPLGPNQERTPDFQTFNLHGKDVPSYEELLGHRDRLLERHPDTRFIACHLSNQGNDLAAPASSGSFSKSLLRHLGPRLRTWAANRERRFSS